MTPGGAAPELGIVPQPSLAADGGGAPDGADNPLATELNSLRETVSQMSENQKLMHAALLAIGGSEPDEPETPEVPAVTEYDFPEIEGLEALTPVMRQVLGRFESRNQQILADNARLRAELANMRRQDHFGFFQAATPGWEAEDKGMAEIFQRLGAQPKDVETLKYVHGLAKDRSEVARLRAENEALKKAGPVPKLSSAPLGVRQRLKAQFPDRGNFFGPGKEFMENLNKVRLRGEAG